MLLALLAWLSLALGAGAAEVMPPKPAQWFNDYAGVVAPDVAARLNARLQQFERDTSNQVVVAVWRDMQTDSSVQDYTDRIAESWKFGGKDRKNGLVLFVFTGVRKMFMQVGYGLEGAVPDATAKRIIDMEIEPHFKAGDYGAGLAAGVDAIVAAAKGEYTGTGHIAGETTGIPWLAWIIIAFVGLNILAGIIHFMRRGIEISGSGWRWLNILDTVLSFLQSSGGGIAFGGGRGGWSSGGGGGNRGISSGGGSFGGGGAGGSW